MFSALFENVINDEFLITLGTGKFEKTFKNSKESMKYIQLNSNDSTKKNSMKNSNQTRKRSQIMLIVFYNLKLSEIAQNIMFHKTIIDLLKKTKQIDKHHSRNHINTSISQFSRSGIVKSCKKSKFLPNK